jgi:CheY-like chemotaxis protein
MQPPRPASRPSLRVLVVDDHFDTAQTLTYLLREMGHDVKPAITGDSAIDIAKKFLPQVVLLDLVLPDIEGPDLARMLRALPGLRNIRIFAVTGYGDEEDRRRAREAGCDGHFLKPLDPAFLESLLAKHV